LGQEGRENLTSSRWHRVAAVAGLVALLSAANVLSPAGAGPNVSKRFVRQTVAKQVGVLRKELDQSIRALRLNASSIQLVGPVAVGGTATETIVATLPIPDAGHYVVNGKLWWTVINSSSTGVGGEIDCDLLAGEDFDTSRESGVTDFDYGTLSLQLTHSFSGPGTVALRCRDEFGGGNPVEVHNVVLTAVEVFALGSSRVGRAEPTNEPVEPRP
jgi:hypothetical protein